MPRDLSKRLKKYAGWARAREIGIEAERTPDMTPRRHQSMNQATRFMRDMVRDLTEAADLLKTPDKEPDRWQIK